MSETLSPAPGLEARVTHLAEEQSLVLLSQKCFDQDNREYRVFAVAEDTPEAISAAQDLLSNSQAGPNLVHIEAQLLQARAEMITAHAQALADQFTWDEFDQTLISEPQLVELLVSVINEKRKI